MCASHAFLTHQAARGPALYTDPPAARLHNLGWKLQKRVHHPSGGLHILPMRGKTSLGADHPPCNHGIAYLTQAARGPASTILILPQRDGSNLRWRPDTSLVHSVQERGVGVD